MTIQKMLLLFEPKEKNLLSLLQQVNAYFGYVSREDTYRIADYFGVAPARIYGLLTVAGNLNFQKPARLEVAVCTGPNCQLKGAMDVLKEIENYLFVKADRQPTEEVNLKTISCAGHFLAGPVVVVNGNFHENVKPFEVDDILRNYL